MDCVGNPGDMARRMLRRKCFRLRSLPVDSPCARCHVEHGFRHGMELHASARVRAPLSLQESGVQ